MNSKQHLHYHFSFDEEKLKQFHYKFSQNYNLKILSISEVFYDTDNFDLMRNGIWLRNKNGTWYLVEAQPSTMDENKYEQTNDEEAIISKLNIFFKRNVSLPLHFACNSLSFVPQAIITTRRHRFQLKPDSSLAVNFDAVDLGNGHYTLVGFLSKMNDSSDSFSNQVSSELAECLDNPPPSPKIHSKIMEFVRIRHPLLFNELAAKSSVQQFPLDKVSTSICKDFGLVSTKKSFTSELVFVNIGIISIKVGKKKKKKKKN